METERMKRPKYLTCGVNAQSTEMLKVPAGKKGQHGAGYPNGQERDFLCYQSLPCTTQCGSPGKHVKSDL